MCHPPKCTQLSHLGKARWWMPLLYESCRCGKNSEKTASGLDFLQTFQCVKDTMEQEELGFFCDVGGVICVWFTSWPAVVSHQKRQNWQPCTKWSFIIVFFLPLNFNKTFSLSLLRSDIKWWCIKTAETVPAFLILSPFIRSRHAHWKILKLLNVHVLMRSFSFVLLTCSLKNKQSRGF